MHGNKEENTCSFVNLNMLDAVHKEEHRDTGRNLSERAGQPHNGLEIQGRGWHLWLTRRDQNAFVPTPDRTGCLARFKRSWRITWWLFRALAQQISFCHSFGKTWSNINYFDHLRRRRLRSVAHLLPYGCCRVRTLWSQWTPPPTPHEQGPQETEEQIAFHQIMEYLIGCTAASEPRCCLPGLQWPLRAWHDFFDPDI